MKQKVIQRDSRRKRMKIKRNYDRERGGKR